MCSPRLLADVRSVVASCCLICTVFCSLTLGLWPRELFARSERNFPFEAMHHCGPGKVLPCGVRCWMPASQCLGLGLGAPFRLSLCFLRFSSTFSLIVMSTSARCCALLAAPGKWSLTLQLWKGCLALCCTKCISPAAWCCALLAAPKTGGL